MAEIDAVKPGDSERKDELEEAYDSVNDPESPATLAILCAASKVEAHFESGDRCCCEG